MQIEQLEGLFQQALEINRTAFEGREFDVAYHALMAALHCGQSLHSAEHLRKVEELAMNQFDLYRRASSRLCAFDGVGADSARVQHFCDRSAPSEGAYLDHRPRGRVQVKYTLGRQADEVP